ncbi:MAG: NAD(P)/FAD-dependent oxidoreductase [Syntrophobacterales bacterium]
MIQELRSDVLVVGAGPAGCMAAIELAGRGVNVLVVDRSQFPREKICGDGLLEDSLEVLEGAGLATAVRDKAHAIGSIRFVAPNGNTCDLEGDFYTLRRRELDALLLEKACDRGASFLAGIQVEGPLLNGDTCVGALGVDEEGNEVRIVASLVLLATGANSRILSAFGVLETKRHNAIGLRGYFRVGEALDESVMIVSYDPRLLPGYGWMFPLGGGIVNVGCGIFLDGRRKMPQFGENLTTFYQHVEPLASYLRGAERVAPIQAAHMRTGLRGARAYAPGLLVLGEALGLTFAFIGEGISCALESGRIASSAAIEAFGKGDFSKQGLARYEHDLRQILERRHRGYLAAQQWFRFKPLANLIIARAARHEAVRKVARQIICGQRDVEDVFSLRGMARVLLLR